MVSCVKLDTTYWQQSLISKGRLGLIHKSTNKLLILPRLNIANPYMLSSPSALSRYASSWYLHQIVMFLSSSNFNEAKRSR